MSDDARPRDPEIVEEARDELRMSTDADIGTNGPVASTEAEKIDDDHPMPGRQARNEVAPEVARSGESVYEHDRVTGAARAGSVVVQPRAREIDELASHGGEKMRMSERRRQRSRHQEKQRGHPEGWPRHRFNDSTS
jgi:hypothetical protein